MFASFSIYWKTGDFHIIRVKAYDAIMTRRESGTEFCEQIGNVVYWTFLKKFAD